MTADFPPPVAPSTNAPPPGELAGGSPPPEARPARHARHDEILAQIARYTGSSLELDEVLERIVQAAAELTGADRASILLLDRSGELLLPSALHGMEPDFVAGWKRRPIRLADEPLSREVLATGRPVIVEDAPTDPRTDKASVAFFGDRSILVAPLISRGRILGTLFLNHVRERYHFTPEDVATTTAIANQAAIAIDNARLLRDTRRLAEQLRRSFRYAGEALASGVDLPRALQMMVQLAVETVDADGGSLHLIDETGRGTYLVTASGGAPVAGADVVEFPLIADGRRLGALALWRRAPPFSADERELLTAFAGHARSAIEHAQLYARLQEEQQHAQEAERTRAEFASMISHELRTPLALIKAYVATLLRPGLHLAPETVVRFLEGIDSACDRLRRLIDNLLSTTTLESGAFRTQPRPIEVHELLRHALAGVAVLAGSRPVEVAAPAEEVWLLADPDQLTQVIENLIGNALKYAPGASPVRVVAERLPACVRISVMDSGPGLPPETLELVFEKFYRVGGGSPSEAVPGRGGGRRPPGVGLGLFICKRIVEAHGGRIWAENLAEGGAAFRFELPVSARTPYPSSPDDDHRLLNAEPAPESSKSKERADM